MEALVLTAYTILYVIGVLVASTILAGIGKKRKYQQRRPKEDQRPKQTFRGICALPGPPGRAEARMAGAVCWGG